MGNINTSDLFVIHELCLFSLYKLNKNNYKYFIDIGANIGVHSLIAQNLGFTVRAFEPDPWTYEILMDTVKNNNKISIYNNAVASKSGKRKFIRVKDNLTASGFDNSGKDYYGDTESFYVNATSINELEIDNSIVKIDAEGSEVEIIDSIDFNNIKNSLFLIEISNNKNKSLLWSIMKSKQVEFRSQKIGWELVKGVNDLPNSWREGSVSICFP